jgi:hypothetical protein
MTQQIIDFKKCTITFGDEQIVHLHFKEGFVVELEEVQDIFETINSAYTNRNFRLLVTAGEKATLSPEARAYASSHESSDVIVADAIVVRNYSHEMTANFFIRFNKPHRPTNWFKDEADATKWLKTFTV